MFSENMQQIFRRTLMPKCDFNKVAKQLSEYLFLGTPLGGCFWQKMLKHAENFDSKFTELNRKYFRH